MVNDHDGPLRVQLSERIAKAAKAPAGRKLTGRLRVVPVRQSELAERPSLGQINLRMEREL